MATYKKLLVKKNNNNKKKKRYLYLWSQVIFLVIIRSQNADLIDPDQKGYLDRYFLHKNGCCGVRGGGGGEGVTH